MMVGADPAANPTRTLPWPAMTALLVTLIGGKPHALLYRPVVPGGAKRVVPFSSPSRTINIDRVDDVSGDFEFAAADGNYEFSIPLSTLGLNPAAGPRAQGRRGDPPRQRPPDPPARLLE